MKRIEIKGFKSIAKKTSLPIADGITCIAGPNGCGKSNIIDAIRWALGEQSNRSLRAGSMNEVIFSGTSEVGPSSMAEVTLEFGRDSGYFPQALEGFEEVSVTRKLFSTGESVYLMNGVRCRLKDVTDLFLDTGLDRHGYAIVEQGKVKDIIQSKPEDIRYLIEEAAEVGKFRVKRIDAMKRLEATAGNLDRIRDLLSEVSKQRDDLKSQAGKARRYQSVRDEINGLTKVLWAYEIRKISEKKAALDEERISIEGRIETFRKQQEEYAHSMKAHEERLMGVRQKKDEANASLQDAKSRHAIAQREIEAVEKRKQDLSSTLEMLSSRIEQLTGNVKELSDKKQAEGAEMEALERDVRSLEEESQARLDLLEDARKAHQEADRDYHQGRAKLFDSIGHLRALEQRITALEARKHEVSSNSEKRRQDLSELCGKRQALQEKLDALEAEASRKRTQKEDLDTKIHSLEERMHSLQSEIEVLAAEVVSHEKTHAQVLAKITMLDRIIRSSTKPIPPDLSGLNGTKRVADALTVKPGYEATVGRSMGSSLDYLIVRDHKEILDLKAIEAGGPGYIPKTPHVHGRETGPQVEGPGVIGPLSGLVDAHEGYEDVILALSKDMVVVEDIRSAVLLWDEGHRSCSLVTRDGTILDPTGVVRTTAEMEKYAEGLKAKAEMEETLKYKATLEEEITHATGRLASSKAGLQQMKEELEASRKQERVLKGEIDSLVEGRHVQSRDMERLDEREQSFGRDVLMWQEMAEKIEHDLASITSEKGVNEEAIEKMQDEIKLLDTRKASAKQALDLAEGAVGSHRARMSQLSVLLASKRERIGSIEEQMDHMTREIARDAQKSEELKATSDAVLFGLEKAQEELKKAWADAVRLEEVLRGLTPEYDDLSDMLASLTQSRDECGETLAILEREKNNASLKHKEQEIALAMSLERFSSRFGEDPLPEIPEGFDPEEARDRALKAEARIEKMGQINFASLEAYEQVQARWDDLHRQYEDVVQASTRLKEVIANIEQQSMKAFLYTFERIKTHFQELFTTIFGGGRADLVLTEGSPMEAGVEILACPPFKKLKTMTLLSEGEKTLCALSFIFALFKVRPSPFCILDEVDAPLDDANVIRFNRLIRAFSSGSQFIMVTHNRYTMEMADILYGVTFDVPGVSKVVSMALQASA